MPTETRINLENTYYFRQKALELVPTTIDTDRGLLACSAEYRYGGIFGRDSSKCIEFGLADPLNFAKPVKPEADILAAAMKTAVTINEHRGKVFNPAIDELPGRVIHELLSGARLQPRIQELAAEAMPVEVDRRDSGLLVVKNYYAGDATSLFNVAQSRIIEALDYLSAIGMNRFGISGEEYLDGIYPSILEGLAHDNRLADIYGSELPLVDPKNARKDAKTQCWRDGFGSYFGEDGYEPQPPFIFLNNSSYYVLSLERVAGLARRKGDYKIADDCSRRRERAKLKIQELFWNGEFYDPLIDRNGRVSFVSCDPVDALYSGVVPEERVSSVVGRLMEPDMMTRFGLRTRSSNSKQYTEYGKLAYQNGSIWDYRTKLLTLFLLRSGRVEQAVSCNTRSENYLDQKLFSELSPCTKDTEELIKYMEEDPRTGKLVDEDVSCKVQAWNIFTQLGVSAAMTRLFESEQRLVA